MDYYIGGFPTSLDLVTVEDSNFFEFLFDIRESPASTQESFSVPETSISTCLSSIKDLIILVLIYSFALQFMNNLPVTISPGSYL